MSPQLRSHAESLFTGLLAAALLFTAPLLAETTPTGSVAAAPAPPGSAPVAATGSVPTPPAFHGMPHPMPGGATVAGSPYASDLHRLQAAMIRRGQQIQPQTGAEASTEIPPGTIAILVQSGERKPLADVHVKLSGTHRSIDEGDRHFDAETTTDGAGHAAFTKQETDTAYTYEISVEQDGAKYTSGAFSFPHQQGMIVSLYVYPVTTAIEQAFIFTRALFAVEPRSDVFQVQALFRFHNGSGKTWRAKDYAIPLPPGARAFQPGNAPGIALREQEGRVLLDGTFTPGQKELSFAFQMPNEREETASVAFPLPPNLVDAKVVVETSSRMGLRVPGFEPAVRSQSPNGQAALLAQRDFLESDGPPGALHATITGLPPRSHGATYTAMIAGAIAIAGLAFAFSRENRRRPQVATSDRSNARELILDELMALERAHSEERIGPKTYEQTKRALLDSLARLDVGERSEAPSLAEEAPPRASSSPSRTAKS